MRRLIDSYFERAAWMGSPLSSADVEEVVEGVYSRGPGVQGQTARPEHLHELAILLALASLGVTLDMEAEPLSQLATRYLEGAQDCLIAGGWMVYTTIPAMRALCLVCRALPYVNIEFRWDVAWQLTGSCLRLILAMGLHRDGSRWQLDGKQANDRRRIFWDWMATNSFMSANWDRLPGLSRDQYDTLFPDDWLSVADDLQGHDRRGPGPSFFAVHAELSRLASDALCETQTVGPTAYARVMDIYGELLNLESALPYPLRCRAALLVMASRYKTTHEAQMASPEPDWEDTSLLMQQHYLVFAIYRVMYTCLHAYFVSALKDSPHEPTSSAYGAPFMMIVERSSMVVAALTSLYSLSPLVSLRHWLFWTHGFSAAMVLGAVLVVSPGCALAPMVMEDLNRMVEMIPVLRAHLPREHIRRDVEWLSKLRQRARVSVEAWKSRHVAGEAPPIDHGAAAGEELKLLGWRTRLIRRRAGVPFLPADTTGPGRPDPPPGPNSANENGVTGEPGSIGFEASWWHEPMPLPLQQDANAAFGGGGQDIDDWFQSVFNV